MMKNIPMKTKFAILLIAALGIICYSYSLGGKFIWDDIYFIVENTAIRSLDGVPSFFTNPSTLARGKLALENYRPLVTLSYAIDFAFWGLNTFGYHLVNTLFHVANGILVFLLLKRFTQDEVAFFAALLFIAHPVQTEAVSWISGRSNVMFAFFYLTSLIFYVDYSMKKTGVSDYIRSYGGFAFLFDRANLSYIYSILLFCLALLSKEAAATLPIVVMVLDFTLRGERTSARLRRWLPYFAILFLYMILRFFMLGKLSQRPFWGESLFQTWLTIPKIILDYISVLFWPLGLCVDRQIRTVSSVADPGFISGAFLTAALFALVAVSFRKSRKVSFFASWFIITLAPFLNIIPINILVAERFLYIPSVGIYFLFSLALYRLLGQVKHIFFLTVLLLIVPLSTLTINRNLQWKDSYTLFESDIKSQPRNARLHNSLAVEYMVNGETVKAERQFKKAMLLDGEFIYNYINLGKFYFEQGRLGEAEEVVRKGLAIDAEEPELLNTMAVLYVKKGDYNNAESMLNTAIEENPGFFGTYLNMGRLLEEKGSYEAALIFYMDSLSSFDSDYEKGMFWFRIAGIYERQGKESVARELYRFMIREYPNEPVLQELAAEQLEK